MIFFLVVQKCLPIQCNPPGNGIFFVCLLVFGRATGIERKYLFAIFDRDGAFDQIAADLRRAEEMHRDRMEDFEMPHVIVEAEERVDALPVIKR